MKRVLAALSILIAVSPAGAVHRPTESGMDKVVQALAKARQDNEQFISSIQDYDRINRQMHDPVAMHKPKDPDALSKAEAAKNEALRRRLESANSVISAIVQAYDIHPRDAAATPVTFGPCSSCKPVWAPHFGEMELEHVIKDEHGNVKGKAKLTKDTDYLGVTWADGEIVIAPNALFNPGFSPGMIAAIIAHETAHFGQLTSVAWGANPSAAAMEFAAHKAMESYREEFGLTKEDLDFIEGALQKSLEKNLKNPDAYMVGGAGMEPESLEAVKAGGDAAFLQGIQQVGPISRSAKETFLNQEHAAVLAWQNDPEYLAYRQRQAEQRRREDEETQRRSEARAVERRAEEEARYARYESMRLRWAYLRETTGLACSDPDALERLAAQGRAPGVTISDLDLEWEMSRIEVTSGQEHPVVNECQTYILKAIMGAHGLVSGRDIVSWGRDYRRSHPTALHRFITSIADFFRALGSAFPDDNESSGRSSREDSPRERPEGREPATPDAPKDWSSYRALRGFNGF